MLKKIIKKDLEYARKLRNKNSESFFDPRKINKITHDDWFEVMQKDPDSEFYIIYDSDDDFKTKVGTISAHETMDNVEIGNIIIEKKHRRKGYCKNAIFELLELYPGKQLFVEIFPNKKMTSIYEAIGFKEKRRTLWM